MSMSTLCFDMLDGRLGNASRNRLPRDTFFAVVICLLPNCALCFVNLNLCYSTSIRNDGVGMSDYYYLCDRWHKMELRLPAYEACVVFAPCQCLQ